MFNVKITDQEIEKLEAKGKRYKQGVGKGLNIVVQPNGSKCWHFRYRFDGVENQISWGVWPEVTIEEACERTIEARKLLKQGIAPNLIKKQRKGIIPEILVNKYKYYNECLYCHKVFGRDAPSVRYCTYGCNFHDKYIFTREDDCWLWNVDNNDADPTFTMNNRKTSLRRFGYEVVKHKIPEKMFLFSQCGNRRCVNPHHVNLGHAAQKGKTKAARKINAEIARKIKADARNNNEIAIEYKISRDTVYDIKAGRTWNDV